MAQLRTFKWQTVVTLVIGIAIGSAMVAFVPLPSVHAQPRPSGWSCFVLDRFPDAAEAADWSGARDVTRGLNQVARNVAPGTIIVPQINQTTSLVCVKN